MVHNVRSQLAYWEGIYINRFCTQGAFKRTHDVSILLLLLPFKILAGAAVATAAATTILVPKYT